jgi:hypothetical protein
MENIASQILDELKKRGNRNIKTVNWNPEKGNLLIKYYKSGHTIYPSQGVLDVDLTPIQICDIIENEEEDNHKRNNSVIGIIKRMFKL